MARLRRPPYTKPIPPGAEIVTHKAKPHARFKDAEGRAVVAPLTKKGDRIRLLSKKWYGEYRDADDVLQCVPLSTDKTAAGQMLADLVRKAELKKANIGDPFEKHSKRPLAEHLAGWEASLHAGGVSAKHRRQRVTCARAVLEGCRFVFPADLSASRVQEFVAGLPECLRPGPALDAGKEWYTKAELAGLLGVKPGAVPPLVRRHGMEATGNGKARRYPKATAVALLSSRSKGSSVRTSNFYLGAVKQFCRWMVRDRRMADNPLAHLAGGNEKVDRRHDRRPLSLDELCAVFQAARQSSRAFRGLTGGDRAILYSLACAGGFRASELGSLCPDAFDLDGDPPTVTLPAGFTKNGRTAVQPLPPDVVEALRGYLAGRPPRQPVWLDAWCDDAAEMLQIDLEAAGIPYVVDGPDGPLYADFHALRHSYIALLDKSGASLKEAMQLARHSDPKLTMAVYGRAQLHDLGQAVRRLPALLTDPTPASAALAATGTDREFPPSVVSSLRSACASGDVRSEPVRVNDQTSAGDEKERRNTKPLSMKGVEGECDSRMVNEESAPCRTRTYNPLIKSQLLCQLS